VTAATAERLYELLAASLPAWRLSGQVRREEDDAIVVASGIHIIRVTATPAGTPFRWMVATAERKRGAASVIGVLRAVRSVIDPDYAPVRARIAPSSALPS
jgi:hypothetical protein